MPDIVAVTLVATAWCTLHSLLISHACLRLVRRLWDRRAAWHRLSYNAVSLATLAWAWTEFRARPGDPLWDWHGWWQVPRFAGLALALWFGWLGLRAHDNRAFLGLRQLADLRRAREPAAPTISRAGGLGIVRHPYYLAGVLVMICHDGFTTTSVAWRAVFVLYLFVGARLEERKLLREFGDAYRDYQREVPAFLPRRLRP